MFDMRRREFIALFGGAAAACSVSWPGAARAQKPKLRRIGVLTAANPEPFFGIFSGALRELGYVEGQNIQFEVRSANGRLQLLAELANELVRLDVDTIVASFTPAV
jgi:ABC-type uncharacterized transport system substrate-binding protein